jgi:xylulokinase
VKVCNQGKCIRIDEKMKQELLLGIDIGTYESKGVISDLQGQVISYAVIGHELSMPNPGWVEHDAEKIWWHDFVFLCRQLLAAPGVDAKNIIGVGVSAIAPCVLPVDSHGNPLRPAILYGVDTRAAKELTDLENDIGIDTILKSNGLRLTSHAAGPKILWIRNHEPDIWAKTAKILTGSSYLVYKLTGEQVIDIYTAYAYAPFFDVNRNEWNRDIAENITPLENLPRLLWSIDIAGYVSQKAAAETGLLSGTPVTAGTSDAAAEALSAGLSKFGDLMLMYGSSQFFLQKTNQLISSELFWGHAFFEPETYAFTAGMSTSGSITRWYRDNFAREELEAENLGGGKAYEVLASSAADSPIGARGVIVLPYFSGERSPINDPEACGLVIGLTLRHNRGDLYRGILEGIGYGIRQNLESMQAEGVSPSRVIAVGGGTKNALWLQIVSNISGIDQYIPDQTYGAAYGDAFLAAVGIGAQTSTLDISRWIKYKSVVHPEPVARSIYEDYYRVYKKLYIDNVDSMHRLKQLEKTNK